MLWIVVDYYGTLQNSGDYKEQSWIRTAEISFMTVEVQILEKDHPTRVVAVLLKLL